jgi:phage gp29-like protein
MATLYDHRGDPISEASLRREHTRDDSPWAQPTRESIAEDLNPKRLAQIFRDVNEGDMEAYLTLADEVEERDLHYRSVLSTRRDAVASLKPSVEAVDDSEQQQAIALSVERLLHRPNVADLVFDMMDAVGKGFSVTEILWRDEGDQWWPGIFRWRDPRRYRVDPITLEGLRLDDGSTEGKKLPPWKYIVHCPKLKSGPAVRAGLARPAMIAYILKSYTIRDLARFLEAYGVPARLGRYDQGTPKAQRRRLLRACRLLGSDSSAIIPKGMDIELLEATGGTNADSFLGPASYWDRQVSKLVLGQTSSSEGAAGDYKASQQHHGVRLSLASSDARQVAATLMRDLVRPFVELNFGPQDEYPNVLLPVPVPDDMTKFAAAVTPFIDRGLEVDQDEIRYKLGLSKPDEGAQLLSARPQGPQSPMGDAPGGQTPADA